MKNRALYLALAAGGLASLPVLAEEPQREMRFERLPTLMTDANGNVIPGSGTPFQTNAIGIVYDQISTAFGGPGLTFLASTHIIEDTSFAPGPWTGVTGRAITQLSAAWGNASAAGTPALALTVLIRVWDQDDVIFNGFTGSGTPMINPTAVPKGRVLYNTTTNPGIVSYIEFILGTPIAIDDDDTGVFIEAFALPANSTPVDVPGGTGITPAALAPLTAALWATGSIISPGSSTPNIGRDRNNDGTFTGNPVGAPPIEHNSSTAFRYPVIMRGDIPPPPPPAVRTNLGCLPDAGLVQNQATDGLVWYEICLSGDATDLALKFLDIDTEGSVADLDMALYGTDGAIVGLGNLLGRDEGDGSGNNAQLSFGVGRRAPVGDGRDYDGRDGQLTAGTYYLAVAGAGSSFAPGFVATPVAPTGAAGVINFKTNVNGAALAASVAPTVDLLNDISIAPFTFGADTMNFATDALMPVRGVVWSKFATSAAAAVADNTYLDLNFSFANSTASADGVAYLFDSVGDEVAFSDDEGQDALPQLSFGATAPSRTRGTNPVPFAGENGDLPAGTYYVAMALFGTNDIAGAPGGERWHVRATSASGLDVNVEYYTGVGVTCDSIDFNNDGLFPDDSDLVDFLNVLAGGTCSNDPNCNDIDFNNDGLFPDDNDLVAYLSVLAGGGC
jgi:hypothetical protein